jgi:hypothetical protein
MTLVAGQDSNTRDKTRQRRWAAVVVSLLAHVVVFALIGLNAPKLVAPAMQALPATDVWLMPRLTPEIHKPAEHHSEAARAAPLTSTPKLVKPKKAEAPSPIQAAQANTPAQLPAAASGGGRGAPAPPASAGVEDGKGVQEALRTSVGCDYDKTVHLTPSEKDRCSQHYGEVAKKGSVFSGIDPLKRGAFDAQAAADERKRANRTGPVPQPLIACDGPGSNLGGACLPDSAIAHLRQH